MAGLAGLLAEDTIVLKGLKDSLKTLADHQHEMGMIPSNVQPETGSVSYGSLTGRIDASTWFIIGSVLYYLESGDRSFYEDLTPAIQKALTFLKCCEFNACGWLYTPLSGNWADEYPVHGFTLYDNCLYVWAKKLLLKAERQETGALKEDLDRLSGNFWPGQPNGAIYHKAGYEQALAMEPHHYLSLIHI